MDGFGSSLCWHSANGACAINENDQDYSSIIDKLYLVFLLCVNCGILAKLINIASGGKYSDTISKYVFREICWLHGAATFTIMKLVQPHNLRLVANYLDSISGIKGYMGSDAGLSFMKYSLQSVLAFILWDLLLVSHESVKRQVLINCHHLGLFIAMYYGQGWDINSTDANLKSQTDLDSYLYGYMWAIHSFGFILKYIFPLVGIRVHEGERSKLLDNIKYAYSSVTVYWYYQYFNADSQPGVGLNYQTFSLLVMFCGRFGLNFGTPFLRRVEMTGMFIILVDGLFFKDTYLQRSIAIGLCVLVSWAFHYCYVKKHLPKPSQFFGPDDNELLKAFLDTETCLVHGRVDGQGNHSMKKLVRTWFESNKINPENHNQEKKYHAKMDNHDQLDPLSFASNYPLHYAIAKDDVKLVEQILLSKEVDVNEPLLEHEDATPLQLASFFISTFGFGDKVSLALLKHGANPYIKQHGSESDCVDRLLNTPLGSSPNFFRRYNELCLEKSPAKVVFSDLSLVEKICLVPL